MAAKPTPQTTIDQIKVEWRTGEYSQRELARRHKVSNGVVAKITKGVEQDVSAIVSAGVQYKQGLREHDERMVSAIVSAVDEKSRYLDFLHNSALRNVKESMEALCEGQKDFKDRGDTILKAKETIFGKQPETAIQINNTQQPVNQPGATIEEIREELQRNDV